MLSYSEECKTEHLALTASQLSHFLYVESKPARNDPKDRGFRCSFLSVLLPPTFHALCNEMPVPAAQAAQLSHSSSNT